MPIEMNPVGIVELLNDAVSRQFVTDVTRRAADAARRVAPVGTGAYSDSIGSTEAEPTDRGAQAELYSTDPAWHLVEFGSQNNQPYRPLTSGVIDAGLDLEESSR